MPNGGSVEIRNNRLKYTEEKKSKLGDWHCAMGDKTFTSEAGILYGSQTLVPISPLPM